MSNSKDYEKFLSYLNEKNIHNDLIKNYIYFIPSYYFKYPNSENNSSNKTITTYFKTKFYLKAYLQNITNILNIIKLNEFDLKSIEMNEIKMKRYNFSENIFNFHLEDTGNTFFKNDRLFLDEIFKINLITKGYTTKKKFLKSYFNTKRREMNLENFILNKNVFNKFKFPLYIAFLNDNYTGNSDNKKYYLRLFKNHQNFIIKLFNNSNLIGISSFSPLFEIIEDSSKNNNLNNKNKEINIKNNKKIYKIICSNSTTSNSTTYINSKNDKFYENITENSNLYQTYDINNILEKKIENNNDYFKIFYDNMKNISNRKYDNLYDYIINSLLLEQNFILFITSWIEKETFKKLFRLDNLIKGDIHKNNELFIEYYNTFKPNDEKTNLTNNSTNIFTPINFDTFLKNKIGIT